MGAKIYLGIVLAVGIACFLAGYFVADGRCAKREVGAISKQVKDKNEDQAEITEKITEVRSEEAKQIETIYKTKTVYIDRGECPAIKLNGLQQSLYKAF